MKAAVHAASVIPARKWQTFRTPFHWQRLADWPEGGMTGVTQCQWSAHCPDIAVKLWSRQSSDTFVGSAAKLGDLLTTDRS